MRSTRNSVRRIVALSLSGLTIAATAAGLAATPASADADAHRTDPEPSTARTPGSQMSRAQQVAADCFFTGSADDAVLATVRSVADERKVSSKVRLAMFETVWVESKGKDVPCGDADSAGAYQQRPSQGWGTLPQVQNVTYAATKFLDGNDLPGVLDVAAKHPSWTAGEISQEVQKSGNPPAYDAAESTAKSLIKRSEALGSIKAGDFTWPITQNGEHHVRVLALQELLNQHGAKLEADGIFGTATKSALESFQSSHGLDKDGIAGEASWSHLVVTLKPGSSGHAVKGLQSMLQLYGYDIKVTGTADSATGKAISSFRTAHGLAAGTTADSAVWNALIALKI